ncbi:hypothetical protein [Nocardioides marmorisolisilvae]|uniref:Uncharacterized protein n=1 Tax=Nocardioides marmorisolisilvae TaxID=1542737 RepID=A0A3N0DT38_9ACTN|nr:hypothetical protein [Nocardioides marmorisolisilvae]RNL78807.1 hypothetical protein EFL95_06995 [Nocardioides marmorisolisilvae]
MHAFVKVGLWILFVLVMTALRFRTQLQLRRQIRAWRRGNQTSIPSDDLRRAGDDRSEPPGGYPGWSDLRP